MTTNLSFGGPLYVDGCLLRVRKYCMKDIFKQFIESRTQAISANDTYVAPALIRKLTPEQLDRLSNISPPRERRSDFHW
jgi:hypothetical protein